MGKFTIENLLAEKRAGHEPDVFGAAGESFSTQSPVSRYSTSDEEIEKMAVLLRTANVEQESADEPSFHERIAAALILNEALGSISKHASGFVPFKSKDEENSEDEDKKDDKKKKEDEDEEEKKAEHFVKSAKAQGYSDEQVCNFLEKQAKIKPETLKKLLKGTAIAGGAIGLGAAGHEVGKKKGKKEVAENAARAIPAFYRAGVLKGYRAGLARAAGEGNK